MKKMLFTFAATCTMTVAFASPVPTANLLSRVIQVVQIMEQNNSQVLMMKMDNLTRGQSATIAYELSAGQTYHIVAVGDADRISDIDLSAMNDNGVILASDRKAENIAVVTLTPTTSGVFYFKVSPYAFVGSKQDGFFGLLVTRAD